MGFLRKLFRKSKHSGRTHETLTIPAQKKPGEGPKHKKGAFKKRGAVLGGRVTDQSNHQRRIAKTADEKDAYTPWRKLLCSFQRAGAVKKVKKSTHRRERREIRDLIREEMKEP